MKIVLVSRQLRMGCGESLGQTPHLTQRGQPTLPAPEVAAKPVPVNPTRRSGR